MDFNGTNHGTVSPGQGRQESMHVIEVRKLQKQRAREDFDPTT